MGVKNSYPKNKINKKLVNVLQMFFLSMAKVEMTSTYKVQWRRCDISEKRGGQLHP